MAIPLANASLVAALADCDQTPDKLTNIYLQRRVYVNPEPSAPYSLSDVMGSVACIQDRQSGTNYTSSKSFTSVYNGGAVADTVRTLDPDNGGSCTHQFGRRANKGDAGLIDRHLGTLPPSGRCRVQFETYGKGQKGQPKVEIIGSKTGWLAGGNKYYVTSGELNNGAHVFDFDIDPEYLYLSVNNQTIIPNGSRDDMGTGKFKYIKAFLI
jgi:hypothetical protein